VEGFAVLPQQPIFRKNTIEGRATLHLQIPVVFIFEQKVSLVDNP
jgi:hypothetical protein